MDRETRVLYVNASDVPWIAAMRLMTLGALGRSTLGSGADVHSEKFRAFDKATGKLLWEETLPAAGHATPSTYGSEDAKSW